LSTLEDNALGPAPLTVKDRYRALAVIATSREAIVYAATDLVSGAPVALEVLRPETGADDEFMGAVREQVHRLAKPECEHPALVRIHEWGVTDAGQMFIVLEPVAGASLRDILDERGAFDLPRALRLGMQIGEALETLHRCGIVHGELRPESVLVVRDETGVEGVKLIGVELTSARRTGSGVRLRDRSVVPYLAPEQLQHGESSEAADVHALGLLIQELLTAQRPRANGPRWRPPGDFPAAIGRILGKALETAPGRRYANVSLMVNEMWTADAAAHRTAPGTSVVTPATVERRAAGGRRARSDVAMVAGLVAALLMLGVTAWVVHSDLLGGRLGVATPEPLKAALPAAASQPSSSTVSTTAAPGVTTPSVPPLPPVGAAVAPVPPPLKIVTPPASGVTPAAVTGAPAPPPPVVAAPPTPLPSPSPPTAGVAPRPPSPRPVARPAPAPALEPAPSPPAGGTTNARRVESGDADSRAGGSEARPGDQGDGSAVIDWLLKDTR
jgi:serine/threonine protein kinase